MKNKIRFFLLSLLTVVLSLILLTACGSTTPVSLPLPPEDTYASVQEEELDETKVIEIPGGSLSFEIRESWRMEVDNAGTDTIRPVADDDGVKIEYWVDGSSNFIDYGTIQQYFGLEIASITANQGMKQNEEFEKLELPPALRGYYAYAYLRTFDQGEFGPCKGYTIALIDVKGISFISIRVPDSAEGSWDEELAQVLYSIEPLPGTVKRILL